MAKANNAAKVLAMTNKLTEGFDDYLKVFDMLIEQAEGMAMNLLVKSLELDKEIVKNYKKAWLFKIKEDRVKK